MKKSKKLCSLLMCLLFALTASATATFAFAADGETTPPAQTITRNVKVTKVETENFTENETVTDPETNESTQQQVQKTRINVTFDLPEVTTVNGSPKGGVGSKMYYNYEVANKKIENTARFKFNVKNYNVMQLTCVTQEAPVVGDKLMIPKDMPITTEAIATSPYVGYVGDTTVWENTAEGWVNKTEIQKASEPKLRFELMDPAKKTATFGGGFGTEFIRVYNKDTGAKIDPPANYNDSNWMSCKEVAEYIKYQGADGSTTLPGWIRYATDLRLGNDSSHTYAKGDEITFIKGLHFCNGGGAWGGDTPYSQHIYNGYLDETITLICTGTGWIVKEVGPMKADSLVAIQENSATASLPVTYEFSIRFTNVVSEAEAAELEKNDAYSTKIKIGGKTVKQLNEEITGLVNDDDEPVKAVYLSGYSTDIKVTIVKASGIWNGVDALQLDVLSGLVAESENYTDSDATYHYLPALKYWSTVQPYATTETEAVNITSVSDHAVIDGGANGDITLTFDKPIVSEDYLWYNCMPDYRKTLPAGYVPEKTDTIVSASAYESFLSHVYINGTSLAELYAGEGSAESKSSIYQCHTGAAVGGKQNLAIRSAASNGWDGTQAITIVLKKGLVFESGVHLDYDINVKYTPAAGDDVASTVYEIAAESITATLEDAAIGTDGTYQLTVDDVKNIAVSLTPAVATDEVTYNVSDNTVLKVEEGVLTALKEGNATVTVSAGGKTAEIKVSVKASAPALTGINVNKTALSLKAGGSEKIVVSAEPDGAVLENVTFASSDETVATVAQDGTVTAVGEGTAKITVTCGTFSKEVTVTVTKTATQEPGVEPGNKPEKKGCGSNVAGGFTAIALGMLALGGAMLIRRRKTADK